MIQHKRIYFYHLKIIFVNMCVGRGGSKQYWITNLTFLNVRRKYYYKNNYIVLLMRLLELLRIIRIKL